MKIYHKMLFGFIGISLLVGLVGGAAILADREIQNDLLQIVDTAAKESEGASELRITLQQLQSYTHLLLAEKYRELALPEKAQAEIKRIKEEINETFSQFDHWFAYSEQATQTGVVLASQGGDFQEAQGERSELAHLEELETEFLRYKKAFLHYIDLVELNLDNADGFLHDSLHPQHQKLLSLVHKYQEHAKIEMREESQEIRDVLIETIQLTIMMTIFSFLIVIFLGFFISYTISHPISELIAGTVKIKEGDFNIKVDIQANDEIGVLAGSFNEMAVQLAQTRDEILSSKNYTENIIHSMNDALIVVDPDATIRTVNPSTLELLDYDEQDLIGKSVDDIIEDAQLHHQGLSLGQFIQQEAIKNRELFYIAKDGRSIPVIFSSSLMKSEEGHMKGIVCAARDLTQRKQAEIEQRKLEDQLRQAQKMDALGTLAGGIAHEFNNILGIMQGFSELLLEHAKKGSPEEQYLQKIYNAGERAFDLVKQILTFSRMTDRDLRVQLVAPIVEEALSMIHATIPTTIEIHQSIDANCPPILTDKTQIHQIIMNLCTNAYHAMEPNGGRLHVTLKEAHYDSVEESGYGLPAGAYLKLDVSDTGKGIPPEMKTRLFDPFFTTKESGKGTGLGLSVVHGIVKEHGGKIVVESDVASDHNPGKTTFTIFFPIATSDIEEEPIEQFPLFIGEGRILIVEDEPTLAEFYELSLTERGYQVTVFHDSVKALETFRQDPHQFDLMITDQIMHGLTGTKLSEELLRIRPNFPIILTTGYGNTLSKEEVKAIGILDFFLKPVKIQRLVYKIQELLIRAEI